VRSGEYYKAYCTIASCEDTQLRVYSHGSADAQNPDHSDLPALVSDLLTNHKNRDNIFDVAHRGTRHYDRHVQHKKARLNDTYLVFSAWLRWLLRTRGHTRRKHSCGPSLLLRLCLILGRNMDAPFLMQACEQATTAAEQATAAARSRTWAIRVCYEEALKHLNISPSPPNLFSPKFRTN